MELALVAVHAERRKTQIFLKTQYSKSKNIDWTNLLFGWSVGFGLGKQRQQLSFAFFCLFFFFFLASLRLSVSILATDSAARICLESETQIQSIDDYASRAHLAGLGGGDGSRSLTRSWPDTNAVVYNSLACNERKKIGEINKKREKKRTCLK
jgi:hypothetical protein